MGDLENPTIDEVTTRAQRLLKPAPASSSSSFDDMAATTADPRERERYRIEKKIGAGGMGAVMLAQDQALWRPVAVKVLHDQDEEQRRMFAREAAIAARLDHPNIVPLYDAGVDPEGKPYLAMRYVEGENLRAVIRKLRDDDAEAKKRWSMEARCRVVLQLLSALSLAHARDVLHRDIKPENVMIGPFGEVLVVDWGIACSPAETGGDAPIIGSPRYMSPEQLDGDKLDARSDVYAVSSLFYELLTLEHPLGDMPANTAEQVAAAIVRPRIPAEDVHHAGHPAVPRSLSNIVMRGLERDRNLRFPSADAMARELERYLAGDAPVVCPHTAYAAGLTRVSRVLDAYPRLLIMSTIAVAAFAIFGVIECVRAIVSAV